MSALYPTSKDPPSKERRIAHQRWMDQSCRTRDKAPRTDQPSLLLTLPAELRLLIWEFTLAKDEVIGAPHSVLAILQINQQIASEAANVYYKSNSFALIIRNGNGEEVDRFLPGARPVLSKIRTGCLCLRLELCLSRSDTSREALTDEERGLLSLTTRKSRFVL